MSLISATVDLWKFNRGRTLATLDEIAELPDPQAVLAWRPSPGRAHIAWQFMHIGITEELFATARLTGADPAFADLIPRFKGGSQPDDDVPSLERIKEVLSTTRKNLLASTEQLSEDDLTQIPETMKERGWTIGLMLQIVAWHEPHHQGQAHATFNAWKATNL